MENGNVPLTQQRIITGRWILAATIIGSSMAFIDGTVINVALPALQTDLNATVAHVQWIVEAYALFLSALILVGGSLGDHFGRRLIFAVGTGLFAVTSIWSGLAQSPVQLIAARVFQGIAAALLTPGSLAIIGAYFKGERRGRAIGTWTGFSAIMTAFGPVMGGWLIENVSWRWIFFLNVPLALIVLVILFWKVPESRDTTVKTLDWWGALLATLGLGGVIFGLIESANLGWNHGIVWGTITGGGLALIAFVWVEAHIEAPMMPLNLFRVRAFSGSNLIVLFLYAGLGGILFFMPFNLIQVQGYSATAAGAALLPSILIIFALSRWSGTLVAKYGPKTPLIIGPVIVAAGYAAFALAKVGGSYWVTLFPATVLLGLGMALSVIPATTVVMAAVEVRYTGVASGVNNAISRMSGLLAIAVLSIFVLGTFQANLDRQLAHLDLSDTAARQINSERNKLAGIVIPDTVDPQERVVLQQAINNAFIAGYRVAMLICAGLAFLGSVVAIFMIDNKKPAIPAGEAPVVSMFE